MKSSEPESVWILSCEAIKASSDSQQRYELKVAVLLPDHYQLDEKLNSFLKEQGYLFLYSGQAKRIIQHLEQAEVYDQQAIELGKQRLSAKSSPCITS